jgi:hypothetical protein
MKRHEFCFDRARAHCDRPTDPLNRQPCPTYTTMTYTKRGAATEVFLVLELFRSRLDELLDRLAPLSEKRSPRLTDASIYYRPDTDVALLAVRLDAHDDARAASWVRAFARGAGLPLLDPARLGDGDRRRFYDAYLHAYPIRASGPLGARGTALELARRLGLRDPALADGARPSRRPDTQADLVWPQDPHLGASDLAAEPDLEDIDPSTLDGPPPALKRKLARAGSESGIESDVGPLEKPRGKQRMRDRLRTIPGRPRTVTITAPAPAVTSPQPASAPLPRVKVEAPAPPILARYLRGDEWAPARLRALSLRGAHLATGAPPRVGDKVPIALGYGDTGAVLRGHVVEVISETDARQRGAAGFRVAFAEKEGHAHRQLIALLRKAREAGISLEPPPARAAVRFPLRWPVQLTSGRSRTVASALDISAGGFFLATRTSIATGGLEFQLPLDWGEAPASGRARVARVVTQAMARGRGLSPGYGVEIVELGAADRQRFDAFLSRVRRRSLRRVVVAATPDRAAELTAALGAVGYAVTTCSDTGWLESVPDGAPQPPDAIVLDAAFGLPSTPSATELAERIRARDVLCITTTHDTGSRVRARVDRALGIG